MDLVQAALLADVPVLGRYLFFDLTGAPVATLRESLDRLNALIGTEADTSMVVGLEAGLVRALGAKVPGLHSFAALTGPVVSIPSTPVALLCWLRGSDRGELIHQTRRVQSALTPALLLTHLVDAFRHGQGPNGHGRDLTGYEDGTENPTGDTARQAALLQGAGPGLDGSSFMAVQQWLHDLDAFDAMSTLAQDHMVGRRRVDNEELEDAPESAHVKRTAQESFTPEAFLLRRSMPWAAGTQAGLMFVAFGKSFDAFEAQLRRMVGLEEGVVDALFGVSKPVTSAYFWCPPMRGGQLDLRQLGL
ncbi:MAG: Dyp-type peroxidase [Rhodoferax sp.]|nr:Dyp-type peroxidase [Rhodoferax sp.]NCP54756.1 Dyp-type peroxidase [Rhodoferax sp.]PIW08831.1 MAG: peroxidase [Comamonadaceae bacterium CG17_big_fil_post_rev_8_21_14_2_50_60_13]PIY25184.1 MAG: peroxidase [Comamonadaceae bacterium CG_4_10_14_3_um_filter_60_75]PJC14165.1 MAG: peroxidase [Comamonadaceae bacterium CG_4_9_14_0_8_um_filter_60_18]